MNKVSVFLDADVIFAGAAAPTEHGASHVVLRLGEITLLNCVTSIQAITEVERNLAGTTTGARCNISDSPRKMLAAGAPRWKRFDTCKKRSGSSRSSRTRGSAPTKSRRC